MRLQRALLFVGCLTCSPLLAEELEPDEPGCSESTFVSRMKDCRIANCEAKDFDVARVPIGDLGSDGEWTRKDIEGATATVTYQCAEKLTKVQIFRNVENALKAAAWQTVYAHAKDDSYLITARKGGQWVWVDVEGWGGTSAYVVRSVREKEMEQSVKSNADAWAEEIAKSGRVAIQGLLFDTNKTELQPASEPVLNDVLALLEKNPTWRLRIEGHTDGTGTAAANQKLSEGRAAAVVSWLTAHAVAKERLASEGFGSSKPVAANDTEEGKAKNRRVELVKM